MEIPAGSYMKDPETGELTPNLADEAMAARAAVSEPANLQPATDNKEVEDNA